jgi:hypothetical protein
VTQTEIRLAEIYSYYVDERYLDDLSCSFVEWLSRSMYAKEVEAIMQSLLETRYRAEVGNEIDNFNRAASDLLSKGNFLS